MNMVFNNQIGVFLLYQTLALNIMTWPEWIKDTFFFFFKSWMIWWMWQSLLLPGRSFPDRRVFSFQKMFAEQ